MNPAMGYLEWAETESIPGRVEEQVEVSVPARGSILRKSARAAAARK